MPKKQVFDENKAKIAVSPSLLTKMSELKLPLHIFHNKTLSPMEAIITFLKQQNLTYHEISLLLHRNERNIWTIFNSAKKKQSKEKTADSETKLIISANILTKISEIQLPLHIFHNNILSPMEAVITFLKDSHHLTYHETSLLIHRNERNIWTIYNHAKRKEAKLNA